MSTTEVRALRERVHTYSLPSVSCRRRPVHHVALWQPLRKRIFFELVESVKDQAAMATIGAYGTIAEVRGNLMMQVVATRAAMVVRVVSEVGVAVVRAAAARAVANAGR